MSDRREGRKFEPPPWEREQFEEFTRQREEPQLDDEITRAVEGLAEPAVKDGQAHPAPGVSETPNVQESAMAQPGRAPGMTGRVDEAEVIEMLSRLSAEEAGRTRGDLWKIGLLGSVVTGSVGIMMVVIGVVGLAKVAGSGPVGVFVASVVLLFGAGACALAVWMAMRTLKQQGAL